MEGKLPIAKDCIYVNEVIVISQKLYLKEREGRQSGKNKNNIIDSMRMMLTSQ